MWKWGPGECDVRKKYEDIETLDEDKELLLHHSSDKVHVALCQNDPRVIFVWTFYTAFTFNFLLVM